MRAHVSTWAGQMRAAHLTLHRTSGRVDVPAQYLRKPACREGDPPSLPLAARQCAEYSEERLADGFTRVGCRDVTRLPTKASDNTAMVSCTAAEKRSSKSVIFSS